MGCHLPRRYRWSPDFRTRNRCQIRRWQTPLPTQCRTCTTKAVSRTTHHVRAIQLLLLTMARTATQSTVKCSRRGSGKTTSRTARIIPRDTLRNIHRTMIRINSKFHPRSSILHTLHLEEQLLALLCLLVVIGRAAITPRLRGRCHPGILLMSAVRPAITMATGRQHPTPMDMSRTSALAMMMTMTIPTSPTNQTRRNGSPCAKKALGLHMHEQRFHNDNSISETRLESHLKRVTSPRSLGETPHFLLICGYHNIETVGEARQLPRSFSFVT